MKYTKEQLSNIAIDVIHAIENEKNIYHPEIMLRLKYLQHMFKLDNDQIKEKIQEFII